MNNHSSLHLHVQIFGRLALLSALAVAGAAGCGLDDGAPAETEEVTATALTTAPSPSSLPPVLLVYQTLAIDGPSTWNCGVAASSTPGDHHCTSPEGVTMQVTRVPSMPAGSADGNRVTMVRRAGAVTERYEGAFAANGVGRIWMAGQYTRTTRGVRCTKELQCFFSETLEGPFPFIGRGGSLEGGL